MMLIYANDTDDDGDRRPCLESCLSSKASTAPCHWPPAACRWLKKRQCMCMCIYSVTSSPLECCHKVAMVHTEQQEWPWPGPLAAILLFKHIAWHLLHAGKHASRLLGNGEFFVRWNDPNLYVFCTSVQACVGGKTAVLQFISAVIQLKAQLVQALAHKSSMKMGIFPNATGEHQRIHAAFQCHKVCPQVLSRAIHLQLLGKKCQWFLLVVSSFNITIVGKTANYPTGQIACSKGAPPLLQNNQAGWSNVRELLGLYLQNGFPWPNLPTVSTPWWCQCTFPPWLRTWKHHSRGDTQLDSFCPRTSQAPWQFLRAHTGMRCRESHTSEWNDSRTSYREGHTCTPEVAWFDERQCQTLPLWGCFPIISRDTSIPRRFHGLCMGAKEAAAEISLSTSSSTRAALENFSPPWTTLCPTAAMRSVRKALRISVRAFRWSGRSTSLAVSTVPP